MISIIILNNNLNKLFIYVRLKQLFFYNFI